VVKESQREAAFPNKLPAKYKYFMNVSLMGENKCPLTA
jgi:hypothetical protein